jgi:hypothetical protein
MKITKERLTKIIKEEVAALTEERSMGEVIEALEQSMTATHKDLQMLGLHLKQSGMDFTTVETQVKVLEKMMIDLDTSLQPAG